MKRLTGSVLSMFLASITAGTIGACDDGGDDGVTTTAAPYCASDFTADVRSGPHAGMHLEGTLVVMEKAGGGVSAFLAHAGQDGDEPMQVPATLANGQLTLSFGVEGGTIVGTGAFDGDYDNCPEELEGDFTGPAEGDTGDWIAGFCYYNLSACIAAVTFAGKATCFAGCSYAGYTDAACNQTCGTNN